MPYLSNVQILKTDAFTNSVHLLQYKSLILTKFPQDDAAATVQATQHPAGEFWVLEVTLG